MLYPYRSKRLLITTWYTLRGCAGGNVNLLAAMIRPTMMTVNMVGAWIAVMQEPGCTLQISEKKKK